MNHIRKYSVALLVIATLGIGVKINGVAQQPSGSRALAPLPQTNSINVPVLPNREQKLQATELVTVNLYRINDQCTGFSPIPMELPKALAMDAAIEDTLRYATNGDFTIVGYRLQRTNKVATLDLRLAPDSQRTFASLAPCEANTILGSLRETLVKNELFGITSVNFTYQGQPIIL